MLLVETPRCGVRSAQAADPSCRKQIFCNGMTMRPLRVAIVFVIAVVIAGVVALFLRFRGSQELNYQGRPIDHWFAQLPSTLVHSQLVTISSSVWVMGQSYGNAAAARESFAALDAFGTNAIPYLLLKLQDSDSSVEQKATQLAWTQGGRTLPFRNAMLERGQSVTALIHLKELPPETLRTLASLSTNAPTDVAQAAKYVLIRRNGGSPGFSP